MRFAVFYEHPLGIEHVWGAEHHFPEEYSHSSAHDVFLAAGLRDLAPRELPPTE